MNTVLSLAELPANFTATKSSYKSKAVIATLGVVLFLICYFAMLVGFVLLFQYALMYDIVHINKFTILLKIGAVAGSAMLLLFGIKFMFKKAQKFEGKSVEITKESEPELYAFIQDLVKQTGAPKPKYIGVNNDVNAFVYYGNTFLSLFLPARKNLMIGMGLMNGLNVSEFKAVLAHEFGHFSQSSMRVGSYVYMANRIIHDMVYNRDRWDMLLDQWRGLDIRVSFMAYALMPVVWLVRQFMVLFYKLLNILYASLQREMEFHADKVAVSVSGSEAIVTALWKLEFASAALQEAYQNIHYAAKQNIYSENIYDQQTSILQDFRTKMEHLISEMKIDDQGVRKVFGEEVYSTLSMYDSHPPSSDRERNAKSPYINA
ncbi:MAG: M48 family metalloprotease, partial [Owenweeksia sp.]